MGDPHQAAPAAAASDSPQAEGDGAATHHRGAVLRIGALVLVVVGLVLAFRFTRLRDFVEPARLAEMAGALRGSLAAPAIIPAAYSVLCTFMVPVNALIAATGIVFGPVLGVLYALLGVFAGALVGYGLGKAIGREHLERLAGKRAAKLRQALTRHGLAAVVVCRLTPVAPFGLANMFAGAAGISLRDYLLGTLIGNVPGVILVAGFGGQIGKLFHARSPGEIAVTVAIAVAIVALFVVLGVVAKRFVKRAESKGAAGS